ncbi:hypothetical protein [Caballeronia ptereochthonis]|uniref:hypothetical protein n=1 Tax=Caballeronia ptereochthonis TaxID=1777144 RepID=UPI00117E5B68|nr:hypothetical protein [Caballeronia ptereochthonis]
MSERSDIFFYFLETKCNGASCLLPVPVRASGNAGQSAPVADEVTRVSRAFGLRPRKVSSGIGEHTSDQHARAPEDDPVGDRIQQPAAAS